MQGVLERRMASLGRNGDTRMAHTTPGEIVVPKEVAATRPDIVKHIQDTIAKMGGDPSKYVVGRGSVNPSTGMEEFASSDEIVAAYQSQLGRTPDASEIGYWAANDAGFSGGSFAQGVAAELSSRGDSGGGGGGGAAPAPAPAPAPVAAPAPISSTTDWFSKLGAQYQSTLGRALDADGAAYWQNLDKNTAMTDAELQAVFNQGVIAELNGRAKQAPAPTMAPVKTATIDPVLRTVNPGTETVRGQLNSLLDENGILMQRSGAMAADAANARGLLNTSMGVQAGQAALMDRAIPIATSDAGIYDNAATNNQQVGNSVNATNADALNKASLTQYTTEADLLKQLIDNQAKTGQINQQGQLDIGMQTLKNNASIELAKIEAQYKTAMQSSDSAKTLFSEIARNITNIMSSGTIPAEEKTKLVTQQTELLRSGLAIAGADSGKDFLALLDFTGGLGSNTEKPTAPVADPTDGGTPTKLPTDAGAGALAENGAA